MPKYIKTNRFEAIKIFCKLVENGNNLTKTAEATHSTRQTIANNVYSLEKDLKIKLFDIEGKRYYLTEEGKRFYLDKAKDLVNNVKVTLLNEEAEAPKRPKMRNNIEEVFKRVVEKIRISVLAKKIKVRLKYIILFIVFFTILTISYMALNHYLSNEVQNKNFKEYFQKTLESDFNIAFREIMQKGVFRYEGEQGRMDIGRFFEHLLKTNYEIANKYKEEVQMWNVVVNEQPSIIYAIDPLNKDHISAYTKNRYFLSDDKKQFGWESILRRRKYFDLNPRINHISVYWKDGDLQKSFEDNIIKTNGKISGYRLPNGNIIRPALRGQFNIIKYSKGAILLFIEYNGQQFYEGKYTQDKQLQFFYCKDKQDIAKFDKNLYDLMYMIGLLDRI